MSVGVHFKVRLLLRSLWCGDCADPPRPRMLARTSARAADVHLQPPPRPLSDLNSGFGKSRTSRGRLNALSSHSARRVGWRAVQQRQPFTLDARPGRVRGAPRSSAACAHEPNEHKRDLSFGAEMRAVGGIKQ